MTPEQARQKLISSLGDVRKAFAAGRDDWSYSLLTTLREHSLAIGVDSDLLKPLERLRQEIADPILKARGVKKGTMPSRQSIPMTAAAAAVSTLKGRGMTVSEAANAVARASGLAEKAVKEFRDNIHRGHVAADVSAAYETFLAKTKDWSNADLLKQLDGLHGFLR
jgi:hypothetical protein